jgi:hypothetical protein
MVCIFYNAHVSVATTINYCKYCSYFHNISQKLQQDLTIMFIHIYVDFIDAHI